MKIKYNVTTQTGKPKIIIPLVHEQWKGKDVTLSQTKQYKELHKQKLNLFITSID